MKIVLAEDEPLQAQFTGRLLQKVFPEAELHIVNDGFEVINHCRQSTVHLLIVDLTLNGLRGDRAIAHIRQVRHIHQPCCIVLSTSANQGDVNSAFEAGCDAYFSKSPDVLDSQRQIEALARCWNSGDIQLCLEECGLRLHRLTPAEQQIAQDLGEDVPNHWHWLLKISQQLSGQQITLLFMLTILAYTLYRIIQLFQN